MMKGIVFDMDGVLFDTERLAVEGWIYVGQQMGLPITKELAMKTVGFNINDSKKIFTDAFGDIDFALARKHRMAHTASSIEQNGMPLKPGLYDILEFLSSRGYKLAVATSTAREKAEHYLTISGILRFFQVVVCGDQFEKAKPSPEIYIKACELLALEPADCLAVEDSFPGITAAFRAGMHPVMIPDLIEPNEEIKGMAYAIISDLLGIKGLL